MDRILIAYRDPDRTPLLFAIREMAARHEELEVAVERYSGNYEEAFLGGELDLVCEHLRVFFPARLAGHPVRLIASCQNASVDRLLVAPGVKGVEDLVGKSIVVRRTSGSRISSLYWLKHLGLQGRAEIVLVDDDEVGRWQQWRKVASGEAEAVICSPLYFEAPLAAGLRKLDVPPLPEIGPLFFAALASYLAANEQRIRGFMRSLYRALYLFHHQPRTALAIMAGAPAQLMGIEGEEALQAQYEGLRDGYSERPIPTVEAIANTYGMLADGFADLSDLNPLAMWDLRYVLDLEEERFMERLKAGEEQA